MRSGGCTVGKLHTLCHVPIQPTGNFERRGGVTVLRRTIADPAFSFCDGWNDRQPVKQSCTRWQFRYFQVLPSACLLYQTLFSCERRARIAPLPKRSMMTERIRPLPFSAYSTAIPSTRAKAGKFRGLVGCAPTFDAAHLDYYEFLCDHLRTSRAAAKHDASALLNELRKNIPGRGQS